MPKLTQTEIQSGLAQFHGSEHYYRYMPGFVLTDGAKWLAESAGCYWLYDIAWSVHRKLAREGFACLQIAVNLEKQKATVLLTDGNDRKIYSQRIAYTDFPLPSVTLFLERGELEPGKEGWVILLPGEH